MKQTFSYPYPRPKPPIQLVLLGCLLLSGLLALWLAAFHAFQNVAGPTQAFFAATLIEAGLIIEALIVVRYNTWYAYLGAAVSLAVSGTYNYIQASQSSTLTGWPLLSLALGPLTALTFVALAFGAALKQHQSAIAAWETGKAGWRENQITEVKRAAEEDRQYRRHQEELARKRVERAERLSGSDRRQPEDNAHLPEVTGNQPETFGNLPETNGKLPEWLPVRPKNVEHFRQLAAAGLIDPDRITGAMLSPLIGATDRTARNWLNQAKAARNQK